MLQSGYTVRNVCVCANYKATAATCNCNSISLQDIGSLRLIWHIVPAVSQSGSQSVAHLLVCSSAHLPARPAMKRCMAKGISKVVHRLADAASFIFFSFCVWQLLVNGRDEWAPHKPSQAKPSPSPGTGFIDLATVSLVRPPRAPRASMMGHGACGMALAG